MLNGPLNQNAHEAPSKTYETFPHGNCPLHIRCSFIDHILYHLLVHLLVLLRCDETTLQRLIQISFNGINSDYSLTSNGEEIHSNS